MVLGKIKQILGIDSSTAENEDIGTRVTVENEGDEVTTAGASVGSVSSDHDTRGGADTEPEANNQDSVGEPAADTTDPNRDAEPESSDSAEASVEEIKGIGPAYADRLADIGIETVSELAGADPAEIDAETSIGEGRASTWIARAEGTDD